MLAVRDWTPADDAFVARLSDEAFGEYGARPSRYTLGVTHSSRARTWLVTEGGAPVGMVMLELRDGVGMVLAVAVARQARGRGIGRLLMRVAERHAVARGARRLSLYAADANLAALDLFLRSGFRIRARKPDFYGRYRDACRLEKRL